MTATTTTADKLSENIQAPSSTHLGGNISRRTGPDSDHGDRGEGICQTICSYIGGPEILVLRGMGAELLKEFVAEMRLWLPCCLCVGLVPGGGT